MANYNNIRIKRKSIKGSTLKAYAADTGGEFTVTNPSRATDEKDLSLASTVTATLTVDFYMDIIFPTPVKNIRRLEYITDSTTAFETFPSDGNAIIQYLPLTSNITSTTSPGDFDDNTAGGGAGTYDDFITIDTITGYTILGTTGIADDKSIVTELNTNISAKRIRYRFVNRTNTTHYLNEFKVYTNDGEYTFEFNDSVLTTKAWNSSRYSGKQLSAAKINRFTAGDSTFGKTPLIQNYSRNIYVGNDIVGMDTTEGAAEDNSLLQFDNFSYVQTNTYITVNEDDSVTLNTLNEPVEDDYSEIIGFYQAFYDDFKQGTYCKILMNDLSPKTNLRPSYPIWFNGGQLQKLLKLTPSGSESYLEYLVSDNTFDYDINADATGFLSTVYDETLLNEFYTGSLVGEIPFQPPRDGDDDIFPIELATGILAENIGNLINSAISYKNNSTYKSDKRFFVSFTISGSEAPIRTITTGSVVSTIFRSKNLAELSTGEISSHVMSDHQITFTENTKLHQNYISYHNTSSPTPTLHESGSVIFSQVDDTTPSLLIELNKSSELPEGTGNKPFIILPHNLHPYIKDNLSYFLTQAGIDVGGNTSTILTINSSNRLLK